MGRGGERLIGDGTAWDGLGREEKGPSIRGRVDHETNLGGPEEVPSARIRDHYKKA